MDKTSPTNSKNMVYWMNFVKTGIHVCIFGWDCLRHVLGMVTFSPLYAMWCVLCQQEACPCLFTCFPTPMLLVPLGLCHYCVPCAVLPHSFLHACLPILPPSPKHLGKYILFSYISFCFRHALWPLVLSTFARVGYGEQVHTLPHTFVLLTPAPPNLCLPSLPAPTSLPIPCMNSSTVIWDNTVDSFGFFFCFPLPFLPATHPHTPPAYSSLFCLLPPYLPLSPLLMIGHC